MRRRLPASPGEAPRDVVVFTMFADEQARTPLDCVVESLDALGRPVDL